MVNLYSDQTTRSYRPNHRSIVCHRWMWERIGSASNQAHVRARSSHAPTFAVTNSNGSGSRFRVKGGTMFLVQG